MGTVNDTTLAGFELLVMLAVARLEEQAYGAAVRREIEQRSGRTVSVGALYATLHRLERKGLIDCREAQRASGGRGRPRKYSRLTEEGETALRRSTTALRRMMAGVALVEERR